MRLALFCLERMGTIGMNASIGTVEDRALIEMAISGQTECFSALLDRHANPVKSCIRSLVKDPADVEDLVQNTFIKAWLNLPAFRFESSFRTWITTVAKNEALAFYRYQRTRFIHPTRENLEAFPAASESPEQLLARSEGSKRVRDALGKLPGKYRQVLLLCDFEQMSAPEVAQHLNASIGLVKSRRFRARRMLSTALARKSVTRSGSNIDLSAIVENSPGAQKRKQVVC